MLRQLCIENVALIDKLELTLENGLNILSGETGAGKSIIIDSLNFVLGERADKTLIRYGTDYAVVQAVFEEYLNPQISTYLDDVGIEAEDILILRRKMTAEGKNECRINGRVTTLSILKGLTELLVDIHGQHEHQSLLRSSTHIALLDTIGESKIKNAQLDTLKAYNIYSDFKRELSRYGDSAERERRLDILNYQLEEIERVNVEEGEEETLLAQRKRIRNTEKILSALQSAKSALDGYDNGGVGAELKSAASVLNTIASYDEDIPALTDRLDSAKLEIEDISATLSDMLDKLDFDSRSADKIESRLEEVRAVLRKYGGNYESLQNFYVKAKEEADVLSNAGDRVIILEREIKKSGERLLECAQKLTALRIKVAVEFEKSIIKELKDLGMGGSTFKVDVKTATEIDDITSNGADTVEFLISPNVGEPLKPLAKIISGGEMSRFMLALKNIVAGIDGIGTMVFDEIDTGISGNISAVVSEKLCNISRGRQVIAVTHMPSLAAMADSHYLISKSTENGKTLTHVTLLDDDTDEVARLIGGNDYSRFAIPHAEEMKAWAQRYKDSLQ
ncbi:MAG: DNA repair protein RecN [Bacteroides sp.]|nr:DNA repair protein RecN [Bacillota bacterium]MCM1394400.1 DNA repair protein RecN [[Eubacterium] siraeum]MCM1455673.1 DNA repair protein RecN [Bacteroides sp.]